jgi:Na+/H+ antiporter NhaC
VDFGWLSLLPPLVAIALAVLLRQVIIPLLVAIVCGAAILNGAGEGVLSFLWGTARGTFLFIWDSVTSYDHLRALLFSLLLGAMVGVLEYGGGMVALVERFASRVRSRRGAQTLITALGLGIFFDDYANTLLVGGTMRTTADRYGISRAKLAYLVDTTSAPVAGLSPISTWIVTEISYVAAGLAAASITDVSAFGLLIASLPFRFYPILALVMVVAIAVSDRDFGPMRDEVPEPYDLQGQASDQKSRASRSLGWAAIVTIVGCIAGVMISLTLSGLDGVTSEGTDMIRMIGGIISHGDSYGALIHGGLTGLTLALLTHRWLGGPSWRLLGYGAYRGALQMLPAMAILWLAWALSAQTDAPQLNTGGYIAGWLSERVSPVYLPTAVFLISSGVAFSTGTSWGTMAIITPISMHLAITVTNGQPYDPIALATLGSVLAGSIFGDHCSPISDTTVLSSRASGCDHMTHVRTQMPYALSVGGISIVMGTIPVAFGISPYVCLLLGCLATIGMVAFVGKKPDDPAEEVSH